MTTSFFSATCTINRHWRQPPAVVLVLLPERWNESGRVICGRNLTCYRMPAGRSVNDIRLLGRTYRHSSPTAAGWRLPTARQRAALAGANAGRCLQQPVFLLGAAPTTPRRYPAISTCIFSCLSLATVVAADGHPHLLPFSAVTCCACFLLPSRGSACLLGLCLLLSISNSSAILLSPILPGLLRTRANACCWADYLLLLILLLSHVCGGKADEAAENDAATTATLLLPCWRTACRWCSDDCWTGED